jgi:hypothetical protein
MRKDRIDKDFYPTPDKLIRSYLAQNPNLLGDSTILEACAGDGAIAQPLKDLGYEVEETDISNGEEFDATKAEYWEGRSPDVVFTNPPFTTATPIIEHALDHANKGVIMLLRSSYLEPCKDRRHLLNRQISRIAICNPRPKFRSDTKGSDSATVVFIVWLKRPFSGNTIVDYLIDWHLNLEVAANKKNQLSLFH